MHVVAYEPLCGFPKPSGVHCRSPHTRTGGCWEATSDHRYHVLTCQGCMWMEEVEALPQSDCRSGSRHVGCTRLRGGLPRYSAARGFLTNASQPAHHDIGLTSHLLQASHRLCYSSPGCKRSPLLPLAYSRCLNTPMSEDQGVDAEINHNGTMETSRWVVNR